MKITDGQAFPADLLLLQTSARQGICNIETSNLDGETNLKIKQAVSATYEIQCHEDGLNFPHSFEAIVESAPPNEKMDKTSWKGNFIRLNDEREKVPLNMTQLCLRGCTLRNTKWVIALVMFTGLETKLMQQNKGRKIKRSHVDRTVDKALYVIFAFQAILCIFGAVAYSFWLHSFAQDHWYLPFVVDEINLDEEAFVSTFTYLVLLDILVPISLYVSMELVKFSQAWFINQDADMYYEVNDIPAQARTSNLNEELGQIGYIFSDKTGTLTRNQMEFLRCSVGGINYGPGRMEKSGEIVERLPAKGGIPHFDPLYRFEDNRLVNNLANKHETAPMIDHFLTTLAVCHTVIPEFPACDIPHVHAKAKCNSEVKYQAASPDELALVLAAKTFQYYFHHRELVKFNFKNHLIAGQRCIVNIMGRQQAFGVLEILEFNSTRKRMSVIVVDPRDKKVKLYMKGADNVVRERCTKSSLQKHWRVTERHLQNFAEQGLRTLVCAYKELSIPEFIDWYAQHQRAKTSLENREAEITASAAMIEKDLTLIGATAIEDRLQEGVPSAIAKLAKAGIKIWVLTGDKVETAINIGRSANLLTHKMRGENLIVVDIDESLEDTQAKAETLEALAHANQFLASVPPEDKDNIGIVISGKALGFVFPIRKLDRNKKEIIPPPHVIEEEALLQKKFLGICSQCKAVICCRMSPKQKSQIVTLVRNHTSSITLAIGDGANDVAMIEAAHVGIGIEGLEGKQAVMASDYSIGQFRFLVNLLLIHGAWDYRRLSVLILYSFYKNVTLSMTNMWFAFHSGYSAAIFWDAISGALYNMIFTAFPVLFAAVFNRDISKEGMLKYPQLYKSGPNNEHFNIRLLIGYIGEGCLHSLVLYYFSVFSFDHSTLEDGTDNDQWIASTAMYTAVVILVNFKIALKTTTWIPISHIALWASIASWFVWCLLYTSTVGFNPDMYWVFYRLLFMGNFWLVMLLIPVGCLIQDFVWEYIRREFRFNQADIIQEREAGYIFGPDISALKKMEEDDAALVEIEMEKRSIREKQKEEMKNDEEDDDDEAIANWKKVANRVRGDHLGFVPFIEDETGDAFVMGQREFLSRYLVAKKKREYELPDNRPVLDIEEEMEREAAEAEEAYKQDKAAGADNYRYQN